MYNIWEIMTAIGTCVTGILAIIITFLITSYQNRRKVLVVFSPIRNATCPSCDNSNIPPITLETGFSDTIRVSIINLGAKYIVINGIKVIGGFSAPVPLSIHGTTDKGEGFPLCVKPGGIISIQFPTEKLRPFIPLLGDQQFGTALLIKACVTIQDWKKTYTKHSDFDFDFANRLVEWLNNNTKKQNSLE